MKQIKILGTGCPKCIKLEEAARKAADEMGIEYNLEKVKEIKEIMSYGVMSTPAIVIDGTVKSSGKLLTLDEIKAFLQ